ncbi:GNAT family N-acetyltransferase [Bacillus sp. JCM 19041]|uniref:GNAT family N-acetyltransferase n=1 Tax=Bacillus sp. JCM 19041 TaxID=1460637 RepID=UPI00336A97F9
MITLNALKAPTDWIKLLSLATSPEHARNAYASYRKHKDKTLYGYKIQSRLVGCVGIERHSVTQITILHLAVEPNSRHQHIASTMIDFLSRTWTKASLTAETDREAVGFYYKNGFSIRSLGELYPGTERFSCVRFKK